MQDLINIWFSCISFYDDDLFISHVLSELNIYSFYGVPIRHVNVIKLRQQGFKSNLKAGLQG